jgi:hypothetical protein
VLERYLADFLAFFFPQAHAEIDWQRGYTFLDKELQQVARDAALGRRLADKLVQVWRRGGEETWVLVHIEVQSQEERAFARRMFVYHYRLFDRYDRQVVSLAVLGDEQANWRPEQFATALWGCAIQFTFPVVKLLDYRARQAELEASRNPFATVVLAHLAALETRGDMARRGLAKLELTRRLYERGYHRQEVLDLYRFIDWLLQLPADLEAQVWQQILQYEEAQHVTYISTAERMGHQKGLQEGREQGLQQGLQQGLRQGLLDGLELALELRFGRAGLDLVPELRQIEDLAVLRAVGERLRTATTLDELRQIYASGEAE